MAGGKSWAVGLLVREHLRSLPMSAHRDGLLRHWPWAVWFVGLPAAGAVGLSFAKLSGNVTVGLLVGVGVPAGFLFQVLAWVSNRIASLADAMGDRKASPYELALIRRLDIARANIAYASFLSIVFVLALGAGSMLNATSRWLSAVYAFLLLHLGLTLLLVLVRINRIGQNDRVSALTAHARESDVAPPTSSVSSKLAGSERD